MSEAEHAQIVPDELERDRPPNWEYRYFAAVLDEQMRRVKENYFVFHAERWQLPRRNLGLEECSRFVQERTDRLKELLTPLRGQFDREFPVAVGPPGVAADLAALRRVAESIGRCCDALLDWERSIAACNPPLEVAAWYVRLQGLTEPWIKQVADVPGRIREASATAKPGSMVELEVRFETAACDDLPDPASGLQARPATSPLMQLCTAIGVFAVFEWLFGRDKSN